MVQKVRIKSKKRFKWKLLIIQFFTKNSMDPHVYLPPSPMELGGSKDCHISNIIMHYNWKVHSLKVSTLPKLPIKSKKASNKLSIIQFPTKNWKTLDARVYLLQEWSQRFQRLPSLKYYNVLQLESRFTLCCTAAKSTTLKNVLNKNCSELNLLRKTLWMYIFISHHSGVGLGRLQTLPLLKYYNVLRWETRISFWMNAV